MYLHDLRVEAEWVIAGKDSKDSLGSGTGAARTKEASSRVATSNKSIQDESRDIHCPEMDGAPCISYIHGGKHICLSFF
jgi:hypothetical protein